MHKRPRCLLAAALASLGLACGGDAPPTGPGNTQPDPAVATSVTLAGGPISLTSLGESQKLTATVKDQRGQTIPGAPVTWTSSDRTVVVVDAAGTVTAVAVGSATVTATSGSANAAAAVTVAQVPASLALARQSLAFDAVGKVDTLVVTLADARNNPISAGNVTWATSNTAVAAVSGSGVVTSAGGGTAVITAAAGPLSATARVTVNLWAPQEAQIIAAIKGPVKNFPDGYVVNWALADFNQDGNDDVALSTWTACGGKAGCGTGASLNPAAPLRLFRRAPDGSMEDVSQELLPAPVSAYTNVPVAADFNNDGMTDLFLAGFTDDPPVKAPSKILTSGGGRYAIQDDAFAIWAHGSGAFDVDGDGCMDALTGDNEAPLWRGNCSGSLTRVKIGGLNPVPLQGAPGLHVDGPGWGMDMCVADFNADGARDVLYTDAIVRVADGSGTLHPRNNVILEVDWASAQPQVKAAHALPAPVWDRASAAGTERSHDMRCRVADLDRDGDLDVFIASTIWPDDGVSWGGSKFQVYRNDGNWAFADLSDTAFPGRPENIAFGFNPILRDLNGDGVPDLIFAGRGDGNTPLNPVWLGNGDGTFRVSARVDMEALRRQATNLVDTFADLPAWARTIQVDEIAPIRRATGEYDFLVTRVATDNVPVEGSPFGTPTIFVVFIPMGLRF